MGAAFTAEGFRPDLPGSNLSDGEIGELFIQHLGLALVGSVELQAVENRCRTPQGFPRRDVFAGNGA
jgi:arylformamidase